MEKLEAAKEETSKDFFERFNTLVTHGFVTLAISLGVHSGLFDALVSLHEEERSSQEIAVAAGLKERYVREWLGVMVVARIVDINPETEKYHLPPHRVPFFRAGSDESGLTALTTGVPMLAEAYKKILECLKKDGPAGLPYSDYKEFHSFMALVTKRWIDNHLIQDFVPSMPRVEQKLRSGSKVLDLGCGQGVAALTFAEHFPQSTVVGVDFSKECIEFGRADAVKKSLSNMEFVCCDAASMPGEWSRTFDYIFTRDTIHDLAHADEVLSELYRVLKPGGVFSMLDPDSRTKQSDNIGNESISSLYTISLFHCLPISLYFEGSVGLGTVWGREKAMQYLTTAGFEVDSITNPVGSNVAHYMCSRAN